MLVISHSGGIGASIAKVPEVIPWARAAGIIVIGAVLKIYYPAAVDE